MGPDVSPSLHTLTDAQRAAIGQHGPGAFYMTGEDALQLSGWNITSAARLRASVRFLGIDGRIQASEHDLVLTTDRVIATLSRQLGEGWLLGLTIRVVGATSPYGATFARAQIVRGLEASAIVLGTVCAGYVTSAQPIAFPAGPVRSMIEGPGNIRSITGTDPAAGAEWSETVPTGARWRLLSLFAQLVTDGTAGNRFPRLVVDDGTTTYFASDPPAAQTATQTIQYVTGSGIQRTAIGSLIPFWALPTDLVMMAGHRVRAVTAGIVAGDNWGAPQLLVQEWLEGQ